MSGVQARGIVEAAVRRELFGPAEDEKPPGTPVETSSGSVRFGSAEESRGQFHDAATLQEILTHSDPLRRYGIGVLHPGGTAKGSSLVAASPDTSDVDLTPFVGLAHSEENPKEPVEAEIEVQQTFRRNESDSDDFDLTDANNFKPSAMAISFKCRLQPGGELTVAVRGACYDKITVHIPGVTKPRDWWVRRPFELAGNIAVQTLRDETHRLKDVTVRAAGDAKPRLEPAVQVFSRPVPRDPDPQLRLVTVAVINKAPGTGASSAIFQAGLQLTATGGITIEPYGEESEPESSGDEEEQSISLLYRHRRTYAIGHGCAADWGSNGSVPAAWLRAEPMPAYEVVSLTPDVYVTDESGERQPVTVSMGELSAGSDRGRTQVETVLRLYSEWITAQEATIGTLPGALQEAARRHIARCREALERMRTGWALVHSSELARDAFELANKAMLYQQLRSRLPRRKAIRGKDGVARPEGRHPDVKPQPGQGNWRPFQIAFILASLPELVEPNRAERDLVDLIFFPTGGGKTEAYLGASAISLLARRLRNPDDAGTDTLMRYTLRLLTAQQFLRAASLVCVLEDIRSKHERKLGSHPFGIGIWLGGTSTPNTWAAAVEALGKLRRIPQTQNLFLLLRCPWCGTQMGTLSRGERSGQDVIGYMQAGTKVVLKCIDDECRYSGRKGLPVHVVDDDIYEVRPSIVIGTVDKFAMMAWRPQARRLFGLGDSGAREVSPPGLIIQDELHLISGPLGSMVGLYEPIINELCTDRRADPPVPPKIIASTATIRRYEDQIRGLYGREKVALFPPHGLEEGRSFFAEPATLPDGTPEPGRRYLAVMSASLGSLQTVQVRVTAATLQAAAEIPEASRDGYWTNLNFLNSLRELGNTVSLLQSDVPDYLTGLKRRDNITPRWPRNTMELTSRRRSDEIPKAIEQLQVAYGDPQCVDICLASNIIEVGVDIDRLGLMTIVGQPKTTAQYIQVSGRVGRKAEVSPGLVITIYGAAKPRDRSHYERFRTYHQQLYAQVEPTSVTPFANPVLRRALHAAAIAYLRQVAPWAQPLPFPKAEYDQAIALLRERAELVDRAELPAFDQQAAERAQEWDSYERTQWDANAMTGDVQQGLMRYAGTLPSLDSKALIWDVPTSMRNVDAECRLQISLAYAHSDAKPEEGHS
jgi:hypothetical protein